MSTTVAEGNANFVCFPRRQLEGFDQPENATKLQEFIGGF
jgi:hypothetical protein